MNNHLVRHRGRRRAKPVVAKIAKVLVLIALRGALRGTSQMLPVLQMLSMLPID